MDNPTPSSERLYLSVPEAGKLAFGFGRAASYNAMHRGELPVIRVGKRYVVPRGELYRMFGFDAPAA